ncbi:MAG: transposase [Nanoarchaeota archaeon]
MRLPNQQFRKLVKLTRNPEFKKEIYEPQEQREINWYAYSLSQIKQAKETLNFIREMVKSSYASAVRSNATNPKILAKAILLSEFLHSAERQSEGWIEILGPYVGIHDKIDDWVIGDAYSRPEVATILYEIFLATRESDRILCGDGTGLERTRKQNYESNKRKGIYMTSIIDSREIVQAFDITRRGEREVMIELIGIVSGDSIRLDAGFNSRELTEAIEELFMKPYIYPNSKNNLNGKDSWKYMYLEFFWDIWLWMKEYHQRSHCESFHSAFKRVYGNLTKINYTARFTQITARIILHNFRRLSYFARAN